MKPYRFLDDILCDVLHSIFVRPFEKYPELISLFPGILFWFYSYTFTHENGVLVFRCFSVWFFIIAIIEFISRKIK